MLLYYFLYKDGKRVVPESQPSLCHDGDFVYDCTFNTSWTDFATDMLTEIGINPDEVDDVDLEFNKCLDGKHSVHIAFCDWDVEHDSYGLFEEYITVYKETDLIEIGPNLFECLDYINKYNIPEERQDLMHDYFDDNMIHNPDWSEMKRFDELCIFCAESKTELGKQYAEDMNIDIPDEFEFFINWDEYAESLGTIYEEPKHYYLICA